MGSLHFKFQFIALTSLPYEGRWPGECRVGGVKAYLFCGTKADLSPLSRLRRQLPTEGSHWNDKTQFEGNRVRKAHPVGSSVKILSSKIDVSLH